MSNTPEFIYPQWKKVAWRFARYLGSTLSGALTTEVIITALNYEPRQGVEYIAYIALGAVFSAIAKYFREKATSYNALVHKLPV